jgi:phosphopantothenate synthetase
MGKNKLNIDLNPVALNSRKGNLNKIIVLVNRMVRKIFRPNMEEAKEV